MKISIFNDVIGPVMRGPSSSHCAAALRIGRLARDLMEADFSEVLIEFDRAGSLPTTHETQGSDMGLFGGLLGWDAVDDRLPDSPRALRESGVCVRIETVDTGDPHPSTYRLILSNARERRSPIAVSTDGGMVEVIAVDGFQVLICGDSFETLLWLDSGGAKIAEKLAAKIDADEILLHEAGDRQLVDVKASRFVAAAELAGLSGVRAVRRLSPVLPVLSRCGMSVPFTTCEHMLQRDGGRNVPLWKLAVEYEMARGGLTEPEVLGRMVDIVRVLRRSIGQGLAGTQYDDRVLGYQCGRFEECMKGGRLLDVGALNRIVLYVSALMEVKSSMGVIVAAPTAGALRHCPRGDRDGGELEAGRRDDRQGAVGKRIDWSVYCHAVDFCRRGRRLPGGRRIGFQHGRGGAGDAGRRHARRIRGCRVHGAAEHDRPDLRSGCQSRGSALPGQERHGGEQCAGLREHGLGWIRSSHSSRRGDRNGEARCRSDAARTAMHGLGRAIDHRDVSHA